MVHGDLFPWLVDFDLLARILDGDLRQNFLKYVKSTFLRPPIKASSFTLNKGTLTFHFPDLQRVKNPKPLNSSPRSSPSHKTSTTPSKSSSTTRPGQSTWTTSNPWAWASSSTPATSPRKRSTPTSSTTFAASPSAWRRRPRPPSCAGRTTTAKKGKNNDNNYKEIHVYINAINSAVKSVHYYILHRYKRHLYDQTAGIDMLPIVTRGCLCELANKIGFSSRTTLQYSLASQIQTFRHVQPNQRDKFLRNLSLARLKFPFPHLVSVLVQHRTTGARQLISQVSNWT